MHFSFKVIIYFLLKNMMTDGQTTTATTITKEVAEEEESSTREVDSVTKTGDVEVAAMLIWTRKGMLWWVEKGNINNADSKYLLAVWKYSESLSQMLKYNFFKACWYGPIKDSYSNGALPECWSVWGLYTQEVPFLLRGWLCGVCVSSQTLDARRCVIGQDPFDVCFSVAFSV